MAACANSRQWSASRASACRPAAQQRLTGGAPGSSGAAAAWPSPAGSASACGCAWCGPCPSSVDGIISRGAAPFCRSPTLSCGDLRCARADHSMDFDQQAELWANAIGGGDHGAALRVRQHHVALACRRLRTRAQSDLPRLAVDDSVVQLGGEFSAALSDWHGAVDGRCPASRWPAGHCASASARAPPAG